MADVDRSLGGFEVKPPFPEGRTLAAIFWTIVSAGVGLVWAWIISWRYTSAEHCDPPEPDPMLPCWPSWAENAGAHVALWAWGIGVFVLFWTPVWLSLWVWLRQRRPDPPTARAHNVRYVNLSGGDERPG